MEPKEKLQRNIGIRIRNLRIEKVLTQVDLASETNRDQQSIERLKVGRTNPTYF
jgi:ribosome-binding protein aMBF1 (putative translation factor)